MSRLRWAIYVALSISLLGGPSVYAVERTEHAEGQARKNLRTLLAPIDSLTGKFVHYEFDESHKQLRTLNGEFTLARPLRLFWEIAPPYAQTLISDGRDIYIYDKDLNQVIIRPLDKKNLPLFFLLEGNEEVLATMEISQPDDKTSFFFLSERNSSQPNELFIHFEEGLPYEMHWTNPFGQRVIYIFSELRSNTRLKKNLFRFHIPKGTEIIRDGG